jgi:hypothetical protein
MNTAITKLKLIHTLIDNVVAEYVKRGQMYTVYQIWKDASYLNVSALKYDEVRNRVESNIPSGWKQTQGHHLANLDNTVGRVGDAPQIYHPVAKSIKNYDPDFRLYPSLVSVASHPVKVASILPVNPPAVPTTISMPRTGYTPQKKVFVDQTFNGLFRFNVWLNGNLVPCNLRQIRGNAGKFVKNNAYEAYGVLDNGDQVVIKQDNEGKLYALPKV